MLSDIGTEQGYLKMGFLGFPKSGKSYSAAQVAIGLYHHLHLDGAVAMFDTENGSPYLKAIFAKQGINLVGVKARSLEKLLELARECESSGEAKILIVDSITHPWRELCDSYKDQINESLRAKRLPLRTRLEFQDWDPIKRRWAEWTEFFLNSPLHIIICGRAGYEYDFIERNDGSDKKDLIKTGVKMRTESEFGFEPSLLVEMERVQKRDDQNKLTKEFVHRATVIGDRFAVIDGETCDDPGYEFFKPHVDMLVPGAHTPIDTKSTTDFNVEAGEDQYHRDKRQRTILLEEIEGELLRAWPGQTKEEKTSKANAIESAFGTRSWTKVEGMDKQKLTDGLAAIRTMINPAPQTTEPNGEAA